MARKYLVMLIISTIFKCTLLQTISADDGSTVSVNTERNTSAVNSTIKDPGIDSAGSVTKVQIQPTEQPAQIISASLAQLPILPTILPTVASINNSDDSKLLSAILKQAAADSFDSLKPGLEETASSTVSPTAQSVISTTIGETPKEHRPAVKRPETCSERTIQKIQPQQDELSMIRKCCPVGESFANENVTEQPRECIESDHLFSLQPIAITLYQDCIEDNETLVDMEIYVGNLCNQSLYYSESLNDRMYIIQNGSLLVMDMEGSEAFSIINDYCIDFNVRTGKFDAIVCVSPPVEIHIGTGQTIVYTAFMLVSIPCLFFVTFIHFVIDKLNHLHGLCIGSMSFCLGMGFLLHSISQLSTRAELRLQYAVQYFILAYYMWIFVLCLNLVLFLWIYVLHYVNLRKRHRAAHFAAYFSFAMVLPIFLVIYTKIKRIPGMPSYFQQGWNESVKTGQRYFIPPVSTILAVCFVLLVIAFFGFKKLDEILNVRGNVTYHLAVNGDTNQDSIMPKIDRSFAEQVQLNARCLALLYIIVIFTWILEVVTFYSPGAGDYLAFLEVMNALQGVFILIIFVIIRKKRKVIASWWHDRGSHTISDGTEMQTMNRKIPDAEKNEES